MSIPMPAPGALPARAAQRHIAAAAVDERLQVSVALLLARSLTGRQQGASNKAPTERPESKRASWSVLA
jgi:hypothetical protein